jgi:tetratricopeptide (TPR) repeat protein
VAVVALAMGLGGVSPARAELPPPDFKAERERAGADEVARLARDQDAAAAALLASQWDRQVGPNPEVWYEVGLAWRLAGDAPKARAALDRALALAPGHVAAHYDRGEMRLFDGDLAGAEADFKACVEGEPIAWPGFFRLADIAGRRGDAATFEGWLGAALQRGFTVRVVATDPTWRGFSRDAVLGPVLARLVTVYEGPDVLRLFEGAP